MIAAGFESLLIGIFSNKKAELINYLYYNQQHFVIYTRDAIKGLAEQLHATTWWPGKIHLLWIWSCWLTNSAVFIFHQTAPLKALWGEPSKDCLLCHENWQKILVSITLLVTQLTNRKHVILSVGSFLMVDVLCPALGAPLQVPCLKCFLLVLLCR